MSALYTIGYEKCAPAGLIASLKEAGVKTLIDVREVANSRRAGFAKKALMASLSQAGIGYAHMKALGTPKAAREAARKGDTATMHRLFEAKLAEPESQLALKEAGELAKSGRVCLLCLEHDWRECHRAIVAAHLQKAFRLKPAHLSPEASL